MTEIIAIAIWPVNNKFDIISKDEDYQEFIEELLYTDDHLSELLYLREFTTTESFKDFLEMEHFNVIKVSLGSFMAILKSGKMLVSIIVIFTVSLCFMNMPMGSVC